MAITRIGFHIIAVGQGNGTLIVFYDDTKAGNDKIIDCAVLDFGSEPATINGTGDVALGWAVALLTAMGAKKKIGTVCFSHSDFDHVSLMSKLLDKFPGGRAELPIGPVFFGGRFTDYKKDKVNVLTTLKKYTENGELGAAMPTSGTSFDEDDATPLVTLRGMDFYALVVNTVALRSQQMSKKYKRDNGYAKNTDSFVIVAEFANRQFVMNGDATAATLYQANEVIDDNQAASDHLTDVIHATVPHHGSYSTGSTVQYVGRQDWETIWTTYTDYLKAKTISATSGIENQFLHPDAYILQFFWRAHLVKDLYQDPALPGTKRHYFTAFYDANHQIGTPPSYPAAGTRWWLTMQTAAAVFTNDYYGDIYDQKEVVPPTPVTDAADQNPPAPVPPEQVHWLINLDVATRKCTVEPIPGPPSIAALGRAINAGLPPEQHPPVPDWFEALDAARARAASPPAEIPLAWPDSTS